jgi:hypothetical protein
MDCISSADIPCSFSPAVVPRKKNALHSTAKDLVALRAVPESYNLHLIRSSCLLHPVPVPRRRIPEQALHHPTNTPPMLLHEFPVYASGPELFLTDDLAPGHKV